MRQRQEATGEDAPGTPEAPRTPFSWRFTTPLYLGSSLNPVNSSIIATALVPLATDLGLAVGATSVLVSSLYLASAVAQPTAGKLAEVVGARRVFLGGIVLVLLGGIVGGLGQDLATLTVARVLIGLGTSAAFPCAMVLIRRRAEEARMTSPPGSVLGGVAISGMATAAFGPPLGGLLVGAAGWRWAFLVNIPFTLLALAMTVRWLPADPPPDRSPHPLRRVAARIDLAGVLGFAASMTALVVFLMGLPHPSWPALAVFLVAAVPTVWWELRRQDPFFDLRGLAANGALSRTYLRQALSLLGTYTVMFGVTQWTQDTYGMSALKTGLILLPMGAVSALLSRPLAGRNLVRGPLVAAAVSMLLGSAGILLLDADSPVCVLVLVSLVFGITTATTTVGNQTMLYVATPPERIGTASGLFRTFGYLGTITSSVIGGIVFRGGTSDGGLHTLGLVLVGAGLAVLLLTVLDRRLMRGGGTGGTGAGTGGTGHGAPVPPPAPVPHPGPVPRPGPVPHPGPE
ncbi:MFS transporter [Streptomyces sp. CA-253872]|uniref:MFS transporter n=1 Tax=Streptomyces sp. CA-253872 TaxID=3240067 RepID=UPI003D8B76BA